MILRMKAGRRGPTFAYRFGHTYEVPDELATQFLAEGSAEQAARPAIAAPVVKPEQPKRGRRKSSAE